MFDFDILIPLAGIAMIVLITWIANVTQRAANKRRAELIRQLMEKFSSGENFAKAMQGPEGRQLVEVLRLDGTKEKKTWIGLFIPAAILCALGIGFFVLKSAVDFSLIPAVVISAVGVGLLISSFVAWRADVEEREREGDSVAPRGSRSA